MVTLVQKNDLKAPLGRGENDESPLYLQLAKQLKRAILQGIFPVGARLPTEGELGKQYGVSRHTVREALRVLRSDGLVISKQGAGTTVAQPLDTESDIHQVMSINDLLAFAADVEFNIDDVGMQTLDSDLAVQTGLGQGEQWLRVSGLRLDRANGEPQCRTDYYIHRDYASVGRILPKHHGPVFPLLESLYGLRIVEVSQQVSAVLLNDDLAKALRAEPGSAALEVRRAYRTENGRVIQVTVNTHPASRFKHAMTMRRVRA